MKVVYPLTSKLLGFVIISFAFPSQEFDMTILSLAIPEYVPCDRQLYEANDVQCLLQEL